MPVQSLDRAFAILSTIANHPQGIGITAISQQVELHKATVSRLVATLAALGAVERLPNNEGFRIGPKILSLVQQVDPHQQLVALARPYPEELADVTKEAVSLEIPDGRFILYLDQVQTSYHIRVNSWIGRRYPIHTVTSGALFMADWSNKALERYFADLQEPFASRTIVKASEMHNKICRAEADGYAMAIDEFEDGLTGISAPILDRHGLTMAAINICGPSFRFPAAGQQNAIINRLKSVTQALSDKI